MAFETDNEIISFALDLWGNYIETFTVSMSAEDAKNRNYKIKHHYESNFLTSNQKELVKRIRKLSEFYKNGESNASKEQKNKM